MSDQQQRIAAPPRFDLMPAAEVEAALDELMALVGSLTVEPLPMAVLYRLTDAVGQEVALKRMPWSWARLVLAVADEENMRRTIRRQRMLDRIFGDEAPYPRWVVETLLPPGWGYAEYLRRMEDSPGFRFHHAPVKPWFDWLMARAIERWQDIDCRYAAQIEDARKAVGPALAERKPQDAVMAILTVRAPDVLPADLLAVAEEEAAWWTRNRFTRVAAA